MADWDELEQEMVDAVSEDSDGEVLPDAVDESQFAETGKLIPTVSGGERKKRRDLLEKKTGKDLERKWQQEDREALAEAETLAAPPARSNPQCHTCQSPHRLWIERQLVKGHAYKRIADQIPEGPSRKSIANHFKECMQIDQQATRALLEEEALAIGQNIEEGVRGAMTLRGMAEVLIRKGFQDAYDGVTTVEPKDMIQLMKALDELNANVGTAAVEEAKVAIEIFKEAIQNALIKGDIVEREVGFQLLSAIQEEVFRLREDQEADAMLDRHLGLPPGS